MDHSNFENKLFNYLVADMKMPEDSTIETPPQGMTSQVFFIKSADKELAVKYGEDAMNDVPAYELVAKNGLNIPVPKLYKAFKYEGIPVVVMDRVKYPLLDSIPVEQMARYIPSMVETQRELHKIKSDKPGLLTNEGEEVTWREMMLEIFEGGEFDWAEVASREGLDQELILGSVQKIVNVIKTIKFPEDGYSFLHTDYNQRNLFVDPSSDKITGIIDWEEAMFGDPIYDLARIRMYIWHFELGEDVVDSYYKAVNFTEEERKLEMVYWLSRIIQYLGWYSEELDEFNLGRIKLHQSFLKEFDWVKLS